MAVLKMMAYRRGSWLTSIVKRFEYLPNSLVWILHLKTLLHALHKYLLSDALIWDVLENGVYLCLCRFVSSKGCDRALELRPCQPSFLPIIILLEALDYLMPQCSVLGHGASSLQAHRPGISCQKPSTLEIRQGRCHGPIGRMRYAASFPGGNTLLLQQPLHLGRSRVCMHGALEIHGP